MNLIEVVYQGSKTSQPVIMGETVAVEPGDRINCNFKLDELTSIVRIGDDLLLAVGVSAATRFDGFFTFEFSPKPLILHLQDVEYTVAEVKQLFDVSFNRIDNDGTEQAILLHSGSAVPVAFGQEYTFSTDQFSVKDLQRRIDDLYLFTTDNHDKPSVILSGFFTPPETGQEPPTLQLTDPTGDAKDIIIHPKSAVFQWQGEPLPMAVAGSLYAYYFHLDGADAENFVLTAATTAGSLPAWLSFASLGGGRYLLSGIPTSEAIGKQEIGITAHSFTSGMGLHTQQSFELMVRSSDDVITRPGVDDVAAAEFRKLGDEFAALGITDAITVSESMPYVPITEIAAVSVLAGLGPSVFAQPIKYEGNIEQDFHRVIPQDEWHFNIGNKSVLIDLSATGVTAHSNMGTANAHTIAQGGEAIAATGAEATNAGTESAAEAGTLTLTKSQSLTSEQTTTATPLSEQPSAVNEEMLYRGAPPPSSTTYFFQYIAPPAPNPTPTESPSSLAPTTIFIKDGFDGFTFLGANSHAYGGLTAVLIPNMNGNGLDGLMVTAYIGSGHGAVYYLPGSTSGYPSVFDVNTPGVNGTTYNPPAGGSLVFSAAHNAGDMNGDGLGDVFIVPGSGTSNTAYVIFGHTGATPAVVDLGALATSGGALAITAPVSAWNGGAGLGDINGDGLGDIYIANGNGNAYVLFGQNVMPSSIDVSTLNGTNGFELTGAHAYLGSAGVDLNGDGFNDIAYYCYSNTFHRQGVEVVFGHAGSFPATVDPNALGVGEGLFIFDSYFGTNSGLGYSTANIGNFTNSGFDDILIAERNGHGIYVVFGNPNTSSVTSLDVATLDGTNGFKIVFNGFANIGFQAVGYAGDVNGDGIPDLIVTNETGYGGKGETYVIFGRSTPFPAVFNVDNMSPTEGIKIYGTYFSTYIASGGGDLTGSGLSSFITGSFFANTSGIGAAYVINGANYTGAITQIGTAAVYLIQGVGTHDVIYAGSADHQINMGSGNTFVNMGVGHDIVNGGSGVNTVVYSPFATHVYGGSGLNNTLWLENDNTHINLAATTVFSGFNIINLRPIQELNGNSVSLNAATVNAISNNDTLTINGDAHTAVNLYALDHWTSSSVIAGYTTYTSTSGSVVNVQNGVHVNMPVVLSDAAFNGINGFEIDPLAGTQDPASFASSLSAIHNPLGTGFDYLVIGQLIYGPGSPGTPGIVYLVPGSTTTHAAAQNIDNPSLATVAINDSYGTMFSSDGLGGFTVAGDNTIGVISSGPEANIILNSFSSLAALPTMPTINELSSLSLANLTNGPFNSMSIAGVGEFNGDGLTDLALFSPWVPNIYVVFGSVSPTNLDLSTLNGTNGFEITNPDVGGSGAIQLISANLNGDGFNDIIYHYIQSSTDQDIVIDVLGTSTVFTSPVSSTSLIAAHQAFTITDNAHPHPIGSGPYGFGQVITDIGNFHGSTNDDLAISNSQAGNVYVIFGSNSFSAGTTFDVSSLNGTNGFTLTAPVGDTITAMGFVGDVNGDGKADFAVATYNPTTHVSDLYVLFGTSNGFPATMSMVPTSASEGLIIEHYGPVNHGPGPVNSYAVGNIVGADLNGDGLSDIVYSQLTSLYASSPGAVYVVFGNNFSNHITIQGNSSTPLVINGTSNDVIYAGANDHTINAGSGNNFIDTGAGHDIVNGGSANNTIVFSALDTVNGGTGHNTLLFEQDAIHEDFTATSLFTGIDTIDLKALLTKVGNTIDLNPSTVSTMSNNNVMTVNGGGEDNLILHNSGVDTWGIGPVVTIGGHAYTTYTSAVTHEIVYGENTLHQVQIV